MRVLVQRVRRASVTVGDRDVGEIGRGLLVLVGVTHTDTVVLAHWLADKVAGLRIFNDAEGRMNRDVSAVAGSVLVVSQFTLYGDASHGRRPAFIAAARPELAVPLYDAFVERLRATGLTVATGEFGADMQVELVNDGPVTLMLEREA